MTDHGLEQIGQDEPEGGWVTGPELFDGEVTTVVLCRWTGRRMGLGGPCDMAHRHPPGDCSALYIQADALTKGGLVDQELFEMATEILRRRV